MKEAVKAIIRVKETSLKIIPTMPDKTAIGTKTTTVVAVLAKIEAPTSPDPLKIASDTE